MNKERAEAVALQILQICEKAEKPLQQAVRTLLRQDYESLARQKEEIRSCIQPARRLQQEILFEEVNDPWASHSYLLVHAETRLMNLLFWLELLEGYPEEEKKENL